MTLIIPVIAVHDLPALLHPRHRHHRRRQVVLAVDGGNSKTDLALVAPDGRLLAALRGPTTSHQQIGFEPGIERMASLVADLRKRAGLAADAPPARVGRLRIGRGGYARRHAASCGRAGRARPGLGRVRDQRRVHADPGRIGSWLGRRTDLRSGRERRRDRAGRDDRHDWRRLVTSRATGAAATTSGRRGLARRSEHVTVEGRGRCWRRSSRPTSGG